MITKQFPNTYRLLHVSLILLGVYVISGCAANVTRSAPCTQLRPNMVQAPPLLKGCQLAVVQFDSEDTKIEGDITKGSCRSANRGSSVFRRSRKKCSTETRASLRHFPLCLN